MKPSLVRLSRLMNRRSRSGQSIIIIAFAFFALLAFVGIATDVALLFVRYSSLRRAVDSAAIAAAGQVRENADYVTLNSIARQFIQVHGITPTSVKVETCETEILEYIQENGGTVQAANTARIAAGSDLCRLNPAKLVRVSAQIASPTTFMTLLGFTTITLQASAVSQTAALDVALILDTSYVGGALDTYNEQAAESSPGVFKYPVCLPGQSGARGTNCSGAAAAPSAGNWHTGDCYINTARFGTDFFTNVECNNAFALSDFKPFMNPSPINAAEATGGLAQPWGIGQRSGAAATDPGIRPFPFNAIIGNTALDTTNAANASAFLYTPDLGQTFPNTASTTASPKAFDTYTDPNVTAARFPGYEAGAGGRTVATLTTTVRYECWYNPSNTPQSYRGSSWSVVDRNKANYGWGGCCNDPSIQADSYNGTTPVSNFSPSTGQFNTDPDWYIQDDASFKEAVIMAYGSKIGGGQASQVMGGGKEKDNDGSYGAFRRMTGDKNYSDLLCRPFKDVRDAARRFIKKLDFVRGDRLVLVTFDNDARTMKPYLTSGSQGLPIITDKATAIRTLNFQVGITTQVNGQQADCHTLNNRVADFDWLGQRGSFINETRTNNRYYPNVNPHNRLTYWTAVQCIDSNAGGGVLVGTNGLVDPNWIRRDSVWVMVLLSSGFPNRTPQILDGGIGGMERNWLTIPRTNTSSVAIRNATGSTANTYNFGQGLQLEDQTGVTYTPPNNYGSSTINTPDWTGGGGAVNAPIGTALQKYCDLALYDANDPVSLQVFSTQPHWCAAAYQWGWTYNDPLQSNFRALALDAVSGSPRPRYSFGFCPTWTFCSFRAYGGSNEAKAQPEGCFRQPRPAWNATFNSGNADIDRAYWVYNYSDTTCTANDPDSRHFCMDTTGSINPVKSTAAPNNYACDPNYDPADYARDRVDFAALSQYTATQKGNFVAMYGIFFNPSGATGANLKAKILGVKFMRYVADAGDNGKIDNPIQRWYRDVRDGVYGPNAGNPNAAIAVSPSGGFAYVVDTLTGGRGKGISWPLLPGSCNPSPNDRECDAVQKSWTDPFTPVTTVTRNFGAPTAGTQSWLPNYSATNPYWSAAPYKYDVKADPCAQYDYFYYTGGSDPFSAATNLFNATTGDVRLDPNDTTAYSGKTVADFYKEQAKKQCGQYFYAEDASGINQAFVEIAGRLFTRLSR